jgi:hypothetical protein
MNGETATRWTQLFTYQQMVHPLAENITPRDVGLHIEENLKQKNLHYIFKILSATDDEAFVEFKITDPDELQQDEIQRIIKTKNNIYIMMHYVIKRQDMGIHARNAWISNLKSMPIIVI